MKKNKHVLNELNNKNNDSLIMNRVIFILSQILGSIEKIDKKISTDYFFKQLEYFYEKTIEVAGLTKIEFEEKYSDKLKMCKCLGKTGWVISRYSELDETEKWYDLLIKGKEKDIVYYFENENFWKINSMFENFQSCYKTNPAKRYFEKAKCFFDQMDYMTSAMYLVPLIEFRINELMDFPNGMSYKKKYSQK